MGALGVTSRHSERGDRPVALAGDLVKCALVRVPDFKRW
jgi:hypothetical protein